jgi:hypothetical protein
MNQLLYQLGKFCKMENRLWMQSKQAAQHAKNSNATELSALVGLQMSSAKLRSTQ